MPASADHALPCRSRLCYDRPNPSVSTFASAVVLTFLAMQPAEGDPVRLLTELQQRLARAWVAGDRRAIERIIAPEWTVTGPDGQISTRAEVLRDVFETRTHRITSLTVDDVRVSVFGDAAVVTGRTRGRGQSGNTPYDVEIRFTDMFVRRQGRWQAVASHASLVTAR
jgi:ketosteroid isomerase-like protein